MAKLAQPLFRDVGTVGSKITLHLVEDPIGPFGLHTPRHGETNEQVAKCIAVEHVRVVDNYEGHASDTQLLAECGELIGSRTALDIITTFVLLKILIRDAPVLADQSEGNFPRLKKLDQIRA